jgi:hypothetical protein
VDVLQGAFGNCQAPVEHRAQFTLSPAGEYNDTWHEGVPITDSVVDGILHVQNNAAWELDANNVLHGGAAAKFIGAVIMEGPAIVQDLFVMNSSGVLVEVTGTGSGLNNIVEDATPQFGGNLDMNSYNIEGVTPTEVGYVSGVTSSIQTQLNSKLTDIVGDTSPQLGANLDVNGYNVGGMTPTEMGYVSGVTSSIQTQINAKQATISGATLTSVAVADTDKVLIQDTSDSDNLKTVTALSIAQLTPYSVDDHHIKISGSCFVMSIPNNNGTASTSTTHNVALSAACHITFDDSGRILGVHDGTTWQNGNSGFSDPGTP